MYYDDIYDELEEPTGFCYECGEVFPLSALEMTDSQIVCAQCDENFYLRCDWEQSPVGLKEEYYAL